jgi:hypothetical protein
MEYWTWVWWTYPGSVDTFLSRSVFISQLTTYKGRV